MNIKILYSKISAKSYDIIAYDFYNELIYLRILSFKSINLNIACFFYHLDKLINHQY